jgi:photosystem II stability/assembly factor-like uncharacterized protein
MDKIILFLSIIFFTIDINAQWVPTNGPYEAKVLSLAVGTDGNNDTAYYAGTDFGVYLTKNKGINWVKAGLPGIAINALAVMQNDSGSTTGGTNIFAGANGKGIYHSTDGGNNWTYVYDTTAYIYCLVVKDKNIFAGTFKHGLIKSTNNGTSWLQINSGLNYSSNVNVLLNTDTALFAGTDGGVFLSTNNGTNWTQVNNNLGNTSVLSLAAGPNGLGGTILYAGTESGIYKSSNYGTSWTTTALRALSFQSLAIIPNGTNGSYLFAAADSIIYISTDNGTTWRYPGGSGLPYQVLPKTKNLQLFVNGSNLFAGSYNGVLLSTNYGARWVRLNNGFKNIRVDAFTSDSNNLYSASHDYGVFLSTNNGKSWSQSALGNRTTLCIASSPYKTGSDESNLFVGTEVDGIFHSTDNGESWVQLNTGLAVGSRLINCITVSGTNIFAGINGVLLSANNGASWTSVNSGLKQSSVNFIASSTDAGGTNLFAATDIFGVFTSTNNGTSWTQTGLTSGFILALAVSYTNGNTNIFAGTSFGLYRSTDKGVSWTLLTNGFANSFISALAVSDSNIFAATGTGVYLSTNNGTSWVPVNTGLTFAYISALAVSNNNLFAAIDFDGIWRRSIPEMLTGIENKQKKMPAVFKLEQNYPNPFNPGTIISWQLPEAGLVTLKIYDVLGREVKYLLNEQQSVGEHSVMFNGSSLSSGIYFYRITVGKFSDVKKLILIK